MRTFTLETGGVLEGTVARSAFGWRWFYYPTGAGGDAATEDEAMERLIEARRSSRRKVA